MTIYLPYLFYRLLVIFILLQEKVFNSTMSMVSKRLHFHGKDTLCIFNGPHSIINPVALRIVKTPLSFGQFECNGVKILTS